MQILIGIVIGIILTLIVSLTTAIFTLNEELKISEPENEKRDSEILNN